MTRQKINPQKLIPSHWRGIYVPTKADFVFLGSKNLEYLKQYWRHEEREMVGYIKTVQAQLDTLEGKTIDDVKAMASKYEHPDLPKNGTSNTTDNWAKWPGSLDADSISRKPDATTFNYCGWCKHHENGLLRSNCYIITTCSLIPKEFNNGSGAYGYDKFYFNTPCAITNGTQELLETCIEHLKAKLAGFNARKAEISAYVRFIANAMKQSEEKPYFSSHRPMDWFKLGDEVVCFIHDDPENTSKKGFFATGKVVDGFRHGGGCVSVCIEGQTHTDDCCDGCKFDYGSGRPEVMHKWEYEYLKTHPDYLKVWIRASAYMTDFDSGEMTRAFAE